MLSSIIPELFPLSQPMVTRLAEDRGIEHSLLLDIVRPLEDQLGELPTQLEGVWAPLLHEIEGLREQAWQLLLPVIERGEGLSTETFIHLLQAHSPVAKNKGGSGDVLSGTAIMRWRKRGFLRSEKRDDLTIDTAMAVLMMRLADRKRE